MPMISNLPSATAVLATDLLPIEQPSGTHAVTVAGLTAGLQPTILAPTGSLLGRISLGPGGPEAITLGAGLTLTAGTISVSGAIGQGLPAPGAGNTVSTIAATDLVAAYSSGGDVWLTLADLLNGETLDQLQPAAPAADTDTLAVGQGGASLVQQSFSALWTYLATKLPIAKKRIVELTTSTVLDATSHNDAILVCSQPLTLTANYANMGPGFVCDVINLSTGSVTMGSGIITGTGTPALASQGAARLLGISYSGGSFAFWPGAAMSGGSSSGSTSSTITVAAPATGTTGTALGLSGTVSPGGDSVTVVLGISATSAPTTGAVSATVTTGAWTASLTPTAAGTYFAWATDTTLGTTAVSTAITVAAAASATTVTWGLEPAGSYSLGETGIGANAVMAPGTAAPGLQFGWSTTTTVAPTAWTAGALVNTQGNGDTLWGAYLTAPAAAGTWYCWAETTDAGASTVSAAITVA
ncbi:hypothetical protein [Acidisoma cladoniae]|uniref:hypothetical protein n=1 Tax=Acidisoma cladoniae TaxID=3040935 RepID=UPI0025514BB3|nr:hypothetical protein [Acidisoma sp. PAMC 29798]